MLFYYIHHTTIGGDSGDVYCVTLLYNKKNSPIIFFEKEYQTKVHKLRKMIDEHFGTETRIHATYKVMKNNI